MNRSLLILLGAFSLSACAQTSPSASAAKPGAATADAAVANAGTPATPATAEARVRAALQKINPAIEIDQVGPAAIQGFQEAIVGGQPVYVSDDGRYLVQGTLYDIANRTNLGEASMAKLRRKLLASVPVSDRIVFAPANPKYTVTVFTDVECGYCRKLHSQIADYNKLGIEVQYVAFPRMGLGSEDFKKMVSVWCAADPKQALTDAKNDRPVPARNCKNPVTLEYKLGQRVGLTGTPMVLASDGTMLGGYIPPEQLRAELDKMAAGGTKPAPSTATGSM
jgi:thiol:disulfide interchange protein DsbC